MIIAHFIQCRLMESISFAFLPKMHMHMGGHCWITSSPSRSRKTNCSKDKEEREATTLSSKGGEDVW